ncbi:acyl-CoA dehydrogenase [Chelatococcus sp. SYSU_G07232]|uniref:Acyl-CoA dehydrogenase n=1 Tax=Chelatococcus albus TaxID=3047466 RepID=A0ABT7AFK5_9HYPH|nr:acyl-CoA dehydrogenase [Chelatococcus sp. SYSU_G07232]MDJ1157792.1 acyl-CoA dehydrogenase [Chelatococcus sp. SYSU_G07232]
MSYRAPVADMAFTLKHVAGVDQAMAEGLYGELSVDLLETILEEAGKFANERIAPLNRMGDETGATIVDGKVATPPGWKEVYTAWAEAGWNALPCDPEWGGQGLPSVVQSACVEMWNASSMAFALGPLLTAGAVEAITAHASRELKETYLPKLVAGEWMGTMNLTEPQAGSDLNAVRTRAEPAGDGSYRITGQKIFITYGEHDLTENIVHLVLARLPDAPAGTRGISLFLVPKFLVNPDGTLGARNDLRCHSIEHKMGIHASPTCTMVYGDHGGAIGYLVGEENRGLNCMFTMMNNARLAVGVQGVAIAERAYQHALHYARERRQGRAPGAADGMSPIADHPDVQRMLMTMKAQTQAARGICYMTAAALDRGHLAKDAEERRRSHEMASLLTPVAKAYSTDIGCEVASLGVQVHGGMGFIEETGAAQFMRDARIAPIYEGTNGIQAIDLVMRKLPLSGGETVRAALAEMRKVATRVTQANDPVFGNTAARLRGAVDSLDRATSYLLKALAGNAQQDALAAATPYLRLFGVAQGAAALARAALAAHEARRQGDGDPAHAGRIALARFFADNIATAAEGLEQAVTAGAATLDDAELALAS